MNRYPFYYYLALALFLILSVVFWWYLFAPANTTSVNTVESGQQATTIGDHGRYRRPIEEVDIIEDDDRRQVVANLVNIAIKDSVDRIAEFKASFEKEFDVAKYKLVYADSSINYLQVSVPADEREDFKKSVKMKLPALDLLVWDEVLFSHSNGYAETNEADYLWHLNAIDVDPSDYQNLGGKVTIAVIDNGFDLRHPSLAGKIVSAYNAFDGSSNVTPGNVNHGSHVASIAAGNSSMIKGVCGSCQLMPIQIEDSNGYSSSSYIIRGLLYAIKNNADVVNLSLGSISPNEKIPLEIQEAYIKNGAVDETAFWKELFAYAKDHNTVCVIAAGNSNLLTGLDPLQRSEFTVKVGALDKQAQIASFSNYGSYTTLFAPGVDIIGAKPNNKIEKLDGTSMAAPIVAGYLGLLKATMPQATAEQLMAHLLLNTDASKGIRILKNKNLN